MSSRSDVNLPQLAAPRQPGLCDGCGACCMHVASPPFYGPDYEALPAELKAQVDAYLASPRFADVERPCSWLDTATGRCRHYEHRPQVCRDFDVASSACANHRRTLGLAPLPGSKLEEGEPR